MWLSFEISLVRSLLVVNFDPENSRRYFGGPCHAVLGGNQRMSGRCGSPIPQPTSSPRYDSARPSRNAILTVSPMCRATGEYPSLLGSTEHHGPKASAMKTIVCNGPTLLML